MHGENNIKYMNAQQAKLTHKYHNIKQKLKRASASILGRFFKTIKVLLNSACVGIFTSDRTKSLKT
jgi:hypothetical protein